MRCGRVCWHFFRPVLSSVCSFNTVPISRIVSVRKSFKMEASHCIEDQDDVSLISDLHQLSREDLVDRVIELNREKAELLTKLSAYTGQGANQSSGCCDEKPSLSPLSKDNATEGESKALEQSIANSKILERSKTSTDRSSYKQRPFDFTRYHKRHVALKMAYLGWDFDGFACQESTENTIESNLFAALSKACLVESRADCNYSRCGRTDKGVSAFAQVVSLDVRSNLAEGQGVVTSGNKDKVQQRIEKTNKVVEIPYCHVLNKLLPPEIRVLAWAPVEQEFDARFSCSHRIYKYFFPAANVDLNLMNHAAQKLVGEHDFRNFCKMDVANGVVQFKRNILSVAVQKVNGVSEVSDGYEMCEVTISGSAFLWHQVRCMVAVLLMIGQNLEKPEVIDCMLDKKQCPRQPQYNMASDKPLVLFDCVYEKFAWEHEPGVLEALMKDFQAQWTTHSIKTTLLKTLLENLDDAAVSAEGHESDKGTQWRDNEERDKLVPWRDIKQPQFYQLFSLVPFQGVRKTHKPLMKRAVHESFESKLESVNAKRRKAGKELFFEKATDTELME